MSKRTLPALLAIAGLAAATTFAATVPAGAQVGHDAYRGYHDRVYRFAGRDYCWYDHAWRGPGWYFCGYQWRRDLGWGGYEGWRGWYPHRRHHHHHPHGHYPRPGHAHPPTGVVPAPGKPPHTSPPGGPSGGGHHDPR